MKQNRIDELNKSFSGPVFIFASGASAAEFSLNEYSNIPFIAVNGAVRKFIDEGIVPLAYVFSDESFISNSVELVEMAIKLCKFIFMPYELFDKYLSNNSDLIPYFDKIYFIHKLNRKNGVKQGADWLYYTRKIFDRDLLFDYSLFSSRKNKIGFSKNIKKGYFCIRTIPYIALQLSYYLGFNRVFLVGMDLTASVGRFYDRGDALPTTLDKDYPKHIEPGFKFFSQNVINDDFKVYNLSTNSRVSTGIIPKISLDELAKLI